VITVGGIDNAKSIYNNSSVGPPSYHDGWVDTIHFPTSLKLKWPRPGEPWWTKPDVTAPAVSVHSTVTGGKWDSKTGTSMATPHVAGIAALMLQKAPGLSPKEVKAIIGHTAESLKDRYGRFEVGDGAANAYRAVLHS
jgi:subtilisin family serine protease